MSEMLQNERKVNSKVLILIFSILAFVGLVATEILFDIESLISLVEYFSVRQVLHTITSVLETVSYAIPCILLIIYVCFLYKIINSRVILALSFLSFTYTILDFFIDMVADLVVFGTINTEYLFSDVMFEILPFLPLLLATILVLFGIKYRIFYIIPLVFATFPSVYYFMGCVASWVNLLTNVFDDFYGVIDTVTGNWSYYLVAPIWHVCTIIAFVVMIVFVADNVSLLSKKKKSNTSNEAIENA